MPDSHYDVVVIGGGIIGLASAREMLRRFPDLRLLLVEKEKRLASHQTGHNSGVIHSGIYYKPGSIKARTCVAGAAEMIAFCRDNGIAYEVCGKVIVATSEEEVPRLTELQKRGEQNGIPGLRLLSREELREIEPHCGGIRALKVPATGITDYGEVSAKYAEHITSGGGEIRTQCKVTGVVRSSGDTILETSQGPISTRHIINCAGLHSDRVSRWSGKNGGVQIVPFRGEYYDLVPERQNLVRALIYPVPDPRFPFLGVHFTRRVHGGVDAGPSAVLAFKREGYRKRDVSIRDAWDALSFPGFWRMASKYWRNGFDEMARSFSKARFVAALQKLVPEICEADLVPGGSGVRAQALRRDGFLVDDFQFSCSENVLNVCNVPSPAATASLPIGREIADMAQKTFDLRVGPAVS